MTIHIACQSNARFAPDCAVMLRSLLTENSQHTFVVHFLHDDALPAEDLARLGSLTAGHGAHWDPLQVDPELAAGFPSIERYGGVTAWFRLLLPRLLPDVPRILYLDADLMIVGGIGELWDTPLGEHALAAVTNPLLGADRRRVVRDLGVPDPGRYFNSGVMLMDLARLRANGLMATAEHIARERAVPTPWADQEPLNAALWQHRRDLHPRWNVMNPTFDLPPRQLPWPRRETLEARRDPAIIHFIGPYKPWHARLRHPYAARWFAHLERTPWRTRPIEGRTPRHLLLRRLHPRTATHLELAEYRLRRARTTAVPALRERARRALAANRHLYAWSRAAYRLARPAAAPDALRDVLDALADSRDEVCFLQIGANDAAHNDPLRPYVEARGWRGVMVEPVPYVFERLRGRLAGSPRITLTNAAIGPSDGTIPFFYVAESEDPELPDWYDQIGSFSLENVLHPYHREHIPGLDERVIRAEVPCLTFASLWQRHRLPRLDLVHTDTEGYDAEIIEQIDLPALRPLVLLFEHKHLDSTRRAALESHLATHGYRVIEQGPDSLAVRRDGPLLLRLAVRRHLAGGAASPYRSKRRRGLG